MPRVMLSLVAIPKGEKAGGSRGKAELQCRTNDSVGGLHGNWNGSAELF